MNGATNEWQLKKVVLRYSETGGSSLGVRFYRKFLLQEWKEKNPFCEVKVEHSIYQHPKITAFYKNGEIAQCFLNNLTPKQIEEIFNLYRNSHGNNLYLRHGGPRVWTEKRSIQGLWQPSVELALQQISYLKESPERIKTSPLKYAGATLRLARQHAKGMGKWGSEKEFMRGFDYSWLKGLLRSPFLKR
jgi:large subunit ribosomal protein L43